MTLPWKKDPSRMTDMELVNSLYDGNEAAIVYFFYERFSSTFQYHIYKIFQNRMDVAELVDEFFLYMYQDNWRRLRTYDPSKAALSTWISMVSFRFFNNWKLCKIDFNGVISISDKWETFRGDWAQSCDAGIMTDVREAIAGIESDRDREIAQLLFIEDRPFEEVALKYGLTTDYVYTVKNRLLKKIRQKLEDYGKS